MAEEKRTGERTCVIKIVDLFQGYFIRGIEEVLRLHQYGGKFIFDV